MGRGDPKSGTRWPGRKNGTRCPGTRWFWRDKSQNQNGTLLSCSAPVQAEVQNKTDPIFGKQDKNSFWSEKSRYQGQKCPVTQDACFHDLHKILNNFLSL